VQKFAEAKERESEARLRAAAEAGVAPPKPAAAVDVGKMVGIIAALGVGVGAIGTLFGGFVSGFLSLQPWYAKPVALLGAMLAISGPSILLAWLKLRQRTLGPLLEANGWAVNGRVRVNLPLGAALTDLKTLPEGASRSLDDPFEDRKARGRRRLSWAALVLIAAAFAAAKVFGVWPFAAR
jgi:MFS family permease